MSYIFFIALLPFCVPAYLTQFVKYKFLYRVFVSLISSDVQSACFVTSSSSHNTTKHKLHVLQGVHVVSFIICLFLSRPDDVEHWSRQPACVTLYLMLLLYSLQACCGRLTGSKNERQTSLLPVNQITKIYLRSQKHQINSV